MLQLDKLRVDELEPDRPVIDNQKLNQIGYAQDVDRRSLLSDREQSNGPIKVKAN
jgi:hypothetical protein